MDRTVEELTEEEDKSTADSNSEGKSKNKNVGNINSEEE